jgi:hypothetical protein
LAGEITGRYCAQKSPRASVRVGEQTRLQAPYKTCNRAVLKPTTEKTLAELVTADIASSSTMPAACAYSARDETD